MDKFDYLIMGGGMGGLAIGALLSKSGKKVCLIEANKVVGGHAHTFQKGKYKFCHDVQYLMGCHKGGFMHKFLKRLDLDKKIKFNQLDNKCFDIISFGKERIQIPHGTENYEDVLCDKFPEEEKKIRKYFNLQEKIFHECIYNKKIFTKWDFFKQPWKFLHLLRYRLYTLDDIFNKFNFSPELRAVLAGRIGNLSAKPSEVSFLMYAGMDQAYAQSAYFPEEGMHFFIDEIKKVILDNGGKVIPNIRVKSIELKDEKVNKVHTNNGDFSAKEYISNIDLVQTMKLIKNKKISKKYVEKTQYEYSDSVFWIYLGLKNCKSIEKYFRRANIWHHTLLDINKAYHEGETNNFMHPMMFISVPSKYTKEGILCPKGSHTMGIATFGGFNNFNKLYKKDKKEYNKVVKKIENKLLDVIDKYYLPNIRKHIDVKITHTPVDEANLINVPKGNIYGCRLTPKNYDAFHRITCEQTFFNNLHFVGASVSYPGIHGTTLGAMTLFDSLEKKGKSI